MDSKEEADERALEALNAEIDNEAVEKDMTKHLDEEDSRTRVWIRRVCRDATFVELYTHINTSLENWNLTHTNDLHWELHELRLFEKFIKLMNEGKQLTEGMKIKVRKAFSRCHLAVMKEERENAEAIFKVTKKIPVRPKLRLTNGPTALDAREENSPQSQDRDSSTEPMYDTEPDSDEEDSAHGQENAMAPHSSAPTHSRGPSQLSESQFAELQRQRELERVGPLGQPKLVAFCDEAMKLCPKGRVTNMPSRVGGNTFPVSKLISKENWTSALNDREFWMGTNGVFYSIMEFCDDGSHYTMEIALKPWETPEATAARVAAERRAFAPAAQSVRHRTSAPQPMQLHAQEPTSVPMSTTPAPMAAPPMSSYAQQQPSAFAPTIAQPRPIHASQPMSAPMAITPALPNDYAPTPMNVQVPDICVMTGEPMRWSAIPTPMAPSAQRYRERVQQQERAQQLAMSTTPAPTTEREPTPMGEQVQILSCTTGLPIPGRWFCRPTQMVPAAQRRHERTQRLAIDLREEAKEHDSEGYPLADRATMNQRDHGFVSASSMLHAIAPSVTVNSNAPNAIIQTIIAPTAATSALTQTEHAVSLDAIKTQAKAEYDQREKNRMDAWRLNEVIPGERRGFQQVGTHIEQKRDDTANMKLRVSGYDCGARAPPDEQKTEPANCNDCSGSADRNNAQYDRHIRVDTLRYGYCEQFMCNCCAPRVGGKAGWCSCRANTDRVCMACWRWRYEGRKTGSFTLSRRQDPTNPLYWDLTEEKENQ